MKLFSDYYKKLSLAELREELEFMAYEIRGAIDEEHERSFSREYDEIAHLIEIKEGKDYAIRWPECFVNEYEMDRYDWEEIEYRKECDGDRAVR